MDQLSAAKAAEICEEFDIRGEREVAFRSFIAEFESEWEFIEATSTPLGPTEVNRIRESQASLRAVEAQIRDSILHPDRHSRRLRLDRRDLPSTRDGGLDLARIHLELGLPSPNLTEQRTEVPAPVLQGVLELLVTHGPAIVLYMLNREARQFQAYLDFAPDNEPKRSGRPANRPRRLLITLLLRRYSTFLDMPASYADGKPFVDFCERLLEAYEVEAGDTTQLIKRAMRGHGAYAPGVAPLPSSPHSPGIDD